MKADLIEAIKKNKQTLFPMYLLNIKPQSHYKVLHFCFSNLHKGNFSPAGGTHKPISKIIDFDLNP